MTPNPLTRESEARREGSCIRVYAVPIFLTAIFCAIAGVLGFLTYRAGHPKPVEPDPPEPSNWTLFNQNRTIQVSGSVPGGVYSDLQRAGVLEDGYFYYRYNDLNYRWVSKDNWIYTTTFEVDPLIIEKDRVVLIFDGIDTAAEVVFNGVTVGKTNNMFVRYVFDVKELLEPPAEVTLEVKFESPVTYARRAFDAQLEDYLVPPKCVPKQYQGECHANHIRKMQASFSWDWGPAFPNMGIWKPWRLEGFSSLLIRDLLFTSKPTTPLPNEPDLSLKPGWNVTLQVFFDAAVNTGTMVGNLEVILGNTTATISPISVNIDNFQGTVTAVLQIEEDEVEMWWPNGIGGNDDRPLYALTVIWHAGTGSETTSKSVRVGFRTVELNQDFLDPEDESLGRHYRICVNNVTMFMKGSNWIPAHVLPELVTEQYTRELLEAAAVTHQNCIRVWGGGIYESDVFYEIADEKGLLIWQDFMFACSMYPVDQPFLDTVKEEVKTQVSRLQHHPSILLWAANNENEAALRGNWYGTQPNFDQYHADYKKLYVDTIRDVTQTLDNSRDFVVSSPNNGIESEEEDHVAQHPYSNLYGDVHYYNYLSDAWNWKIYPPTRFASEYGFQSWPSFRSMKNVSIEEDWLSTSALSYHRQHHPGGQEELALEIGLHFHAPVQNGSAKAYQNYLYLTQVHQAVAIKTETEFYRRGMSTVNDEGEGYISGALYWQLNDIWQGPSWASIELGGRWKMLHYFAERFFRPVMVSLFMNNDNLTVSVINDSFDTIQGVTLAIDLHRYDQRESVAHFEEIVGDVPFMEANIVASYNLWDDLALNEHCQFGLYDEVDVCFVVATILTSDGDVKVDDNYLLLGKPKDAPLPRAQLEIQNITGPSQTPSSDYTFSMTVSSDNVALFVWLEVDQPGYFSDNGFLLKEAKSQVEFYSLKNITADALRESFTVMSLVDTYSEQSVAQAKAAEVMDRALHPNDIKNVFYV